MEQIVADGADDTTKEELIRYVDNVARVRVNALIRIAIRVANFYLTHPFLDLVSGQS